MTKTSHPDHGVGYWLKFPADDSVTILGAERFEDSIHVNTGWNLIGTVSDTALVDSIIQVPSGIVVSSYFGYVSQIYQGVTSLIPGCSYWVKVNADGVLVLRGQSSLKSHGMNR